MPVACLDDYGGALTEMVLLGVLAMRVPGKRRLWDYAKGRLANSEKANVLLHPPYRDGWSL